MNNFCKLIFKSGNIYLGIENKDRLVTMVALINDTCDPWTNRDLPWFTGRTLNSIYNLKSWEYITDETYLGEVMIGLL